MGLNEQQDLKEIKHDINNLKGQIKSVLKAYSEKEDDIEELKKQNSELTQRIDRVLTLLEGDEKAQIKGFIARLIALEDFKKWADNKKTYILGYIVGVSAVGGFILTLKGLWGLMETYIFTKR